MTDEHGFWECVDRDVPIEDSESNAGLRALRESEEKFHLLFEKSADPTFLFYQNHFIDCNEAAVKIMGCSGKSQLRGARLTDISPRYQPDGRLSSEKSRELIDEAYRNGFLRFEWLHQTFGGEPLLTEVSITVIPIRGEQVIHSTWRDITERKKVETALKESEERYRYLVELSPIGIFVHANHQVRFANWAFANILGAEKPEDLYGRNVFDFVHPGYHALVEERIRAMESNRDRNPLVEQKFVRNDGSVIDVEVVSFPFDYGGVSRLMVVVQDITERKRVDQALRQREKELQIKSHNLEEANAALRVLLRHRDEDKKNLENAILANTRELVFPCIEKLNTTQLTDNQRTYVQMIESNLNDIVSPFVTKMTAVYARFTPTEVQVANMIKSGKTSKEIADTLKVCTGTVNAHRNSIRSKLGLNNKKINLRTHLLSL